MFDFLHHRSEEEEMMDDFACEGEVVNQTLRELHAINSYLGGTNISLHGIKKLIRSSPKENYRIVDLGCGGGDTLKLFANWGQKKNIDLTLTGVDANPNIISYAIQNTNAFPNISFLSEDVFSEAFKSRDYDIAHCSLFLHHFREQEFVQLIRQLYDQVSTGIVINDLHRHPISYYFTKWLLTAWSRSEMVRYDSVLSVARSFTRRELKSYLHQAGIKNYTLKWKWAFRWEVIIWKG
ncbi:methyltransferase domain-containing protein [Reichenbachiella sp. MSK19-1]|uniref:methyltransferase domain-containing protein n=1 Tax=Reichenbachiella sp. MSK19-1 TaxID=1897631 RepID=UPI000E6CBFAA|nr:methyltransferase domain-containing protein [Reichenbachiella sp. MSK19-1]RJE71328.1 hypothetical protein BGP76_04310 [Reichenbachiella sp. MSK19-1]